MKLKLLGERPLRMPAGPIIMPRLFTGYGVFVLTANDSIFSEPVSRFPFQLAQNEKKTRFPQGDPFPNGQFGSRPGHGPGRVREFRNPSRQSTRLNFHLLTFLRISCQRWRGQISCNVRTINSFCLPAMGYKILFLWQMQTISPHSPATPFRARKCLESRLGSKSNI